MILHVYPPRGVVIGNSSIDSMGNQLPWHARLFTLLVPVNTPMIYNATLQLVKELEDHSVVCDEIIFSIKTNLAGVGFSRYYYSGNVIDVEYPLPKIKLTGQCMVKELFIALPTYSSPCLKGVKSFDFIPLLFNNISNKMSTLELMLAL